MKTINKISWAILSSELVSGWEKRRSKFMFHYRPLSDDEKADEVLDLLHLDDSQRSAVDALKEGKELSQEELRAVEDVMKTLLEWQTKL